MTRTYFQTFNRLDEDETEITVEYSCSGGHPGSWDEPPEGPEVEIVQAWIDDGTENGITVTLTEAEDEKFCTWIAENHEDDEPDYDDRE